MPKHSDDKQVLVPDRESAGRYAVVLRTLQRWDKQPELGFPKPVYINGRRYRRLDELEAWERRMAAQAG